MLKYLSRQYYNGLICMSGEIIKKSMDLFYAGKVKSYFKGLNKNHVGGVVHMVKKFFLSFLSIIYLFIFLFCLSVKYSSAEEVTLTEEQKKQLQEQIQKMKENFEKIKNLSDTQQQVETLKEQKQATPMSQSQLSQPSINEPEWDGIYTVDKTGQYRDLISITKAKARRQKGTLTGRQYISVILDPKEVNFTSWSEFKGFFIKGQKLISQIIMYKLRRSSMLGLDKVFTFLQGAAGGETYSVEDLDNNLFPTQLRCKTKSDSAYCEFKDPDRIKRYIQSDSSSCIMILTGESLEKGAQIYAICFKD
jgi:hypothetical protein